MTRRKAGLVAAGGGALLGLALAGARLLERRGSVPAALVDLHAIEDLQARFNAAAGAPRLILLLSPT